MTARKRARSGTETAQPGRPSGRRRRSVPQEADLELQQAPRTGAKRTVMDTVRELPNFLRLLYGLITDARVPGIDKLVVAGAMAYILMPLDFIPDFIPFLGEVDDVFLLILAIQRLIANAGRAVVEDHWMGDPAELASLNLERVVVAAAFFLPRRLRRRLRAIGRV